VLAWPGAAGGSGARELAELRHASHTCHVFRVNIGVMAQPGRERELCGRFLDQAPVDEALAALASIQHAVLDLGQLRDLGLTANAVQKRAAAGRPPSGPPERLFPHPTPTAPALTRGAAVLACGPGAVLSHRSAAAAAGAQSRRGRADRRDRARPLRPQAHRHQAASQHPRPPKQGGEVVERAAPGRARASASPAAGLSADALLSRWRRLPRLDPAGLIEDIDERLHDRGPSTPSYTPPSPRSSRRPGPSR